MTYFVGLISGTSADAIDAALIDIIDSKILLTAYLETPYPREVGNRLERLVNSTEQLSTAAEFGLLHNLIGRAFANAARNLLTAAGIEPSQVNAIGIIGKTLTLPTTFSWFCQWTQAVQASKPPRYAPAQARRRWL